MGQRRKKPKGQSTVEYILMVAFGAVFTLEVVRFFNGVFQEGLLRLESNVQAEVAAGRGFE